MFIYNKHKEINKNNKINTIIYTLIFFIIYAIPSFCIIDLSEGQNPEICLTNH